MIYRIGKELIFPQPIDVEPDGLLCVGGDLSVDRLLLAYSHGIFLVPRLRRAAMVLSAAALRHLPRRDTRVALDAHAD